MNGGDNDNSTTANMTNCILFIPTGDNGKSVTENLFEIMLGKYAIKLPTSLLVGKRTQSSSACPELVRAGNGVRWALLQEPGTV